MAPIICFTENYINRIEGQIFAWMNIGIKVHFPHLSHQNTCPIPGFDTFREGRHRFMKVIFIVEDLEQEILL